MQTNPIIGGGINLFFGCGSAAAMALYPEEKWIAGLILVVSLVGVLVCIIWFLWVNLKGAPAIKRIPIIDIRNKAKELGWDCQSDLDLVSELKQAGIDGALQFWGRPIRSGTEELVRLEALNPIPKKHWSEYVINNTGLVCADNNFQIQSYKLTHEKGFADLHISENVFDWLQHRAKELEKGTSNDPIHKLRFLASTGGRINMDGSKFVGCAPVAEASTGGNISMRGVTARPRKEDK